MQISRILASLERLERGVSIGDVRLFTNAAIKRESMFVLVDLEFKSFRWLITGVCAMIRTSFEAWMVA